MKKVSVWWNGLSILRKVCFVLAILLVVCGVFYFLNNHFGGTFVSVEALSFLSTSFSAAGLLVVATGDSAWERRAKALEERIEKNRKTYETLLDDYNKLSADYNDLWGTYVSLFHFCEKEWSESLVSWGDSLSSWSKSLTRLSAVGESDMDDTVFEEDVPEAVDEEDISLLEELYKDVPPEPIDDARL